ncbi:ectoine/hydroxyectoine ABC transporter permease subunit EhuD [Azospirillum sp. TSH64]|uniref:ectoine/hydroxyectoine ABC transporter permease subunit EhuD n=1 Tax=Azospirillum sp. TSH64 TaxID=652740 RepID=UPI000D61EC8D|nr:ectoine/hydroxyectoine ABC transporter permease subunit EhuD [Azospirillum sp. TSH64]PWC77429.1 amino acid ABC transporter permease [Azospirillum sp. TSH64]
MEWDWEFVREIMPMLLDGLRITLLATLLGSILAAAAGLGFALLRRSKNRAVTRITGFVVEFIRGTPLLVQLYFLFYVLPELGLLLSPLTAGVVGLGLHYATYTSEVFRAGIDNTPRGQWEAAKACNLTPYQTWRHVILPQAIPPMIPALANYFVAMFKETPLLSAITVIELMSEARGVANSNYRYLEPMTMVGVLFLCISLIAVPALHLLERRFRPPR